MYLGLDINGYYDKTDFLDGVTDELCIYNRALSAEEIKELYYMYVPKAPQWLSGTTKSDGIYLDWHAPANVDIVPVAGYDIYRSNAGSHYVKIVTVQKSSYQDHNVVKDATLLLLCGGKNFQLGNR